MKVEIVQAEPWHVEAIAWRARQADIDELWAQANVTPAQAMRRGMKLSSETFTGLVDGEPVAMFGVTPYSILHGFGTPWLVGSTAMDRLSVQKALLVHSREKVDEWKQRHNLLVNMVDERNKQAIRWLKWLGFSFLPGMVYGPEQKVFLPFYWSA